MLSRRRILAAFMSAAAFGVPAARAASTEYGVTLGKTTLKELRSKYPQARLAGENLYSSGPMLRISGRSLAPGSALYSLTVICSRSGTAIAMQAVYDARAINSIHEYFEKRYKVKSIRNPFIGDTVVEYESGTDEVELRAPEMDPRLTVSITTREFRRLMILKRSFERLPQGERQNGMI
jgi:hypothetical protein